MFFEHLLCTQCLVGYNTDMNSPCPQGTYGLVVENKGFTYVCNRLICAVMEAYVGLQVQVSG